MALFVGDSERIQMLSSYPHPLGGGTDYPDVRTGHYTTWSLLLHFSSYNAPC